MHVGIPKKTLPTCRFASAMDNWKIFHFLGLPLSWAMGETYFYARGKQRRQHWCQSFAKPFFHGGSRGKGSAHRVAMYPLLLPLLAQVFAGTQLAIPCQRRAMQSTPLLCHEHGGHLSKGPELWFPQLFLPAFINEWLTANWYFPSLSRRFLPTSYKS